MMGQKLGHKMKSGERYRAFRALLFHRGLAEEIQVLEAIYIEELDVQRNDKDEVNKITLQLHPATGEDLEQRFVCMTLILDLTSQYPDVPPEFTIKNPRGIAEEEILSLREDMHKLCEDRQGGPVLFELIELAKDSLTAGNIPHCPCMICLEHFHEGEKFTKTECYHYFHESCLSRYVTHVLTKTPEILPAHAQPSPAASKLVCPVCREEIHYKFDDFDISPVEDGFVFTPTEEMREIQADMAAMFELQRAKGGIIDVEAEKNKYLVKNDDVVLLSLPKAESKEKPERPKSAQSRYDKVNEEGKKGDVSRDFNMDIKKTGSNRNNKFGYRKGGGREYRYNEDDSTRDNESRVGDRRDRRKNENTSDNRSRKMNNKSDSIECNNIKDNYKNKGNADNRNRRNYQHFRRKPGEDKFEKDLKGGNGESSAFEKSCKNDKKDMEKVKEKKLEFGRPPEKETLKSAHDSSVKEDSNTGVMSDNEKEIPGNNHKGFGRPKRKDEIKTDTNEDVEAALDCPPTDNCNENPDQSLESKTASKEKSKQDSEKVEDRDSFPTANDRTFKGKRGGFGRPPHKKEDYKGDSRSTQNNQTRRRGGFGRPDREHYRDENFTKENPRPSRGGFGRPDRGHCRDENFTRENPRQNRGGFGRPDREHCRDENFTRENPRQNRGGFGRPDREHCRDENFTRENPRQNRGGFGKPDRHNKESSEDMSRQGSGKFTSQLDRRNSPRNPEDQSKDGDRPWSGSRHSYDKDERHSGNWRSQGRSNRYTSDENWEYSNEGKTFNHSKARRNQGNERSRYEDRHEGGFHRGRGYKPKYGTESEENRPGSRNKNMSPRYSEQNDKDVEKIERKFDSMVVLENSNEPKDTNMSESGDKIKMTSNTKHCDKNDVSNISERSLPSDIGENSNCKGCGKKGPPGFVTSPPPGFEKTERDSVSMVNPPPGFKS